MTQEDVQESKADGVLGADINGHEDKLTNGAVTESSIQADTKSDTALQPAGGAVKICPPPARYVLVITAFFALFMAYALRVNLNVVITAMVNQTWVNEQHHATDDHGNTTKQKVIIDECQGENQTSVAKYDGQFKWDDHSKALVLEGFYFGYVTTQILGGTLAQIIGGKLLLIGAILCTSVLTILTPVAAQFGDFIGIFVVRILEGIGEGVSYPALSVLLSKWAPPAERSKMATFIYAGAQIGTVVTMPLTGVVTAAWGWEAIFYLTGAVGVAWAIVAFFVIFDAPATHPRIDPGERAYIETSLASTSSKKKKVPTATLR